MRMTGTGIRPLTPMEVMSGANIAVDDDVIGIVNSMLAEALRERFLPEVLSISISEKELWQRIQAIAKVKRIPADSIAWRWFYLYYTDSWEITVTKGIHGDDKDLSTFYRFKPKHVIQEG